MPLHRKLYSGKDYRQAYSIEELRMIVSHLIDREYKTDINQDLVFADQVVELAKCQVCHGVNDGLALHGGNRTDSIEQCVMCHNSNATDLAQRPTDSDET